MNIGGHKYKVVLKTENLMKVKGNTLFGLHDSKNCTISINKGATDSRKKETLIHETLHAILTNAGFKEQDEHYIDTISNGLLQLGVGELLWKQSGVK